MQNLKHKFDNKAVDELMKLINTKYKKFITKEISKDLSSMWDKRSCITFASKEGT